MTRTEVIAIIENALPNADEATLSAVAEMLQSAAAEPSALPRELTPRELELIAESKADFEAGRTYTADEVRAYLDEALAPLGVPRSKA